MGTPTRPWHPDVSEDTLRLLGPPAHDGDLGAFGPYRVRGVLGAGGMGVVFEAVDPALERAVALTVMRPALAADDAARKRFLREARAMAAVEHDRLPYLVMPRLH